MRATTKFLAWRRFFTIAMGRITVAVRNRQETALPPRVEMEEDLFRNESRFLIRYKIICARFDTIVRNSGLWRRLDENVDNGNFVAMSFNNWARSLRDNAQAARGILGASFDQNSDIIVDVCNSRVPSGSNRTIAPRPRLAAAPDITDPAPKGDPVIDVKSEKNITDTLGAKLDDFVKKFIDPEHSWIQWQCSVELVEDHHIVRHKPLAGKVKYSRPGVDPFGTVDQVAQDERAPAAGWSATVPDILQQSSAPSVLLRLRGGAIRAGYRVNAPQLVSFGGVPAVLKHRSISEDTVAGTGDVIYFKREWDLIYALPTAPRAIQVPANPLLQSDGE
ncbi:unnamed protein product [uncultured bacterium]|nr:unnamed protein product [uncultured bacterium]